ncbi:zinc metallopeptidase [Permianibacter sp. IMCC34836]|uniref:KPN_02809 family neutral zinc metallopeptidase n=1 Tax=Permianibacter fluminis TaxID=2738515 RepID=UPI0015517006|nr:neutral zinc metallopeptidase [Permianibacter fluminis]NQD38893.1 zinc metallopeptidase [Permianibacter fluminis]
MKWEGFRRSSNVEDRRGMRAGKGLVGGGIGGIVLLLIAMYFGVDPQLLMQGAEMAGAGSATTEQGPALQPGQDPQADFVAHVLGDTEDVWTAVFQREGGQYRLPTLVLFTDSTATACGMGESAMGPFYCPPDEKVYIDLGFYRDLSQRFGAPGDFAQAYVIAHEVGHHVQNLLGLSEQVHKARQRLSEADSNALSVKLELQADCFAGLWAHHAEKRLPFLESGDVEEALTAAAAIGDDRLQQQAGGRVVPESFTHGSSKQRVHWFRAGLEQGQLSACDTFN